MSGTFAEWFEGQCAARRAATMTPEHPTLPGANAATVLLIDDALLPVGGQGFLIQALSLYHQAKVRAVAGAKALANQHLNVAGNTVAEEDGDGGGRSEEGNNNNGDQATPEAVVMTTSPTAAVIANCNSEVKCFMDQVHELLDRLDAYHMLHCDLLKHRRLGATVVGGSAAAVAAL